VIDKTAAELAEEGIEGPGEITVLARKKQPKQPSSGRCSPSTRNRRARPKHAGAGGVAAASDARCCRQERVHDAGAVDRGTDPGRATAT